MSNLPIRVCDLYFSVKIFILVNCFECFHHLSQDCILDVYFYVLFVRILLTRNDLEYKKLIQGHLCSPMVRETWVLSHVESYQKTFKILLDTSLLNTQQYKVRIKGKVE